MLKRLEPSLLVLALFVVFGLLDLALQQRGIDLAALFPLGN